MCDFPLFGLFMLFIMPLVPAYALLLKQYTSETFSFLQSNQYHLLGNQVRSTLKCLKSMHQFQ